jgi:hypothetical protein
MKGLNNRFFEPSPAPFERIWHKECESLLGHTSIETTMIDLHVMKHPGAGAPSPLDLD